jgi:hypothetical protein
LATLFALWICTANPPGAREAYAKMWAAQAPLVIA